MTLPMRPLLTLAGLVLLTGPLGGCVAAAALGGVDAASVAVFGRDIVDIGVSAVSGRDCSIVHLDQHKDYCAAREELPPPDPYCSKTLGRVQCWRDPENFPNLPTQVTDTPQITPDQKRQITSRWPKSLNLLD